MSTVHVPVQFLVVRSGLAVDVAHERSSGRCFVGGARHDHPDADILGKGVSSSFFYYHRRYLRILSRHVPDRQ